jgi:ribosomal protein L13
MCPVCIATAALIAGSTTSTGGLAVLIAKKLRRKKPANEVPTQDKGKENRHGQ